jgi:membrane protein DedA with SNARE-associated domain
MDILIAQGSLGLIFVVLLAAGLGIPIPEDIPLVAAGVLAYQGAAPFWVALLVCAIGVLLGDTMIFMIARRLGPRAMQRKFFQRLLPPKRRERIEKLFGRWGGGVIFGARHVAGLRAPVFAFAGMHGMSYKKFIFYDFLGLCVSAPWMLGVGYWFAGNTDKIEEYVGGFRNLVIIIACVVGVIIGGKVLWTRWRNKRNAAKGEADGVVAETESSELTERTVERTERATETVAESSP